MPVSARAFHHSFVNQMLHSPIERLRDDLPPMKGIQNKEIFRRERS